MAEQGAESANDATPASPLHYVGHIVRFSPPRGVGSVRSDNGREVPFDVRFLEVAGVGRGDAARDVLEEGMRVGFDVGWTASGLRITWIRRLDEVASSQRETGAEGEVTPEEAADENRQSGDVE